MNLLERKVMHMRMQNGAQYGYEVFDRDRGDAVIGTHSIYINKKTHPWSEQHTYALTGDDRTFPTSKEFFAAYREKLKEITP
jgi:hypothetical protein